MQIVDKAQDSLIRARRWGRLRYRWRTWTCGYINRSGYGCAASRRAHVRMIAADRRMSLWTTVRHGENDCGPLQRPRCRGSPAQALCAIIKMQLHRSGQARQAQGSEFRPSILHGFIRAARRDCQRGKVIVILILCGSVSLLDSLSARRPAHKNSPSWNRWSGSVVRLQDVVAQVFGLW